MMMAASVRMSAPQLYLLRLQNICSSLSSSSSCGSVMPSAAINRRQRHCQQTGSHTAAISSACTIHSRATHSTSSRVLSSCGFADWSTSIGHVEFLETSSAQPFPRSGFSSLSSSSSSSSSSSTTNTASQPAAPPSPNPTPSSSSPSSSSSSPSTPPEDSGEVTRSLTPSQLVSALDEYIVGQQDAKKAVAIALRNRWRRHQLRPAMRSEVTPKNILMIGPTGSGKTEIARRLAKLSESPFIKVEATKFTKVGFYGKDVDSIIKDLVRLAISNLRQKRRQKFKDAIEKKVEEEIITAIIQMANQAQGSYFAEQLQSVTNQYTTHTQHPKTLYGSPSASVPPSPSLPNVAQNPAHTTPSATSAPLPNSSSSATSSSSSSSASASNPSTGGGADSYLTNQRVALLAALRHGDLDSQMIDIDVPMKDQYDLYVGFPNTTPSQRPRSERRRVTVKEAKSIFQELFLNKMLQQDDLARTAIREVENDGIVFIDEIDKICTPSASRSARSGADASAEGVQRDLLPLIEGTSVSTPHGNVNTDHILFICSGAFHACAPSDLLPELQGRLPIRVQLKALTEEDYYRILTTKFSLIRQQIVLLKTDGVDLSFSDGAIKLIAKLTMEANRQLENIGARRLNSIIQKLMEEINFTAADMKSGTRIDIDEQYVKQKSEGIIKRIELEKFIM